MYDKFQSIKERSITTNIESIFQAYLELNTQERQIT